MLEWTVIDLMTWASISKWNISEIRLSRINTRCHTVLTNYILTNLNPWPLCSVCTTYIYNHSKQDLRSQREHELNGEIMAKRLFIKHSWNQFSSPQRNLVSDRAASLWLHAFKLLACVPPFSPSAYVDHICCVSENDRGLEPFITNHKKDNADHKKKNRVWT